MRVVVEALDISHRYQTNDGGMLRAIDRASLTVGEGEFVSLVGPSGCGKSTLLKIVAGLIEPSEGTVQVQGQSPFKYSPNFGIVFQTPILLPWRTVAGNVSLPLELRGMRKAERLQRVGQVLELVGLDEFSAASPRQLSGGMQQRVAIARALATKAPLLLMDEPFGQLDALTREQMNLELQRICAAQLGESVLFVTHSIQEAIFLSDRVVVMSGRPSTIRDEVTLDFPRPRSLDILGSEEFGRSANRIRKALDVAHASDLS